MSNGRLTKRRVWVLVKAYPQPSRTYEETVCCAGISEDGAELLRLFPIRYRALPESSRFDRFDLIEADVFRYSKDPRPESNRVSEDSITVVRRGRDVSRRSKADLWRPHVSKSFQALKQAQKDVGTSLGIVRPDPESLRFHTKAINHAAEEEREAAHDLCAQQSLLETPLQPLPRPEYVFAYRFTSGGQEHRMQIHDWEVQAAWYRYKRDYGDQAMDRLQRAYGQELPAANLHLIMGTQLSRPWQFMIIGLLRTSEDLDSLASQGTLF